MTGMNRICRPSVFNGVDVSADAEVKLCELDRLAPEVIGTGRPARYAALAGELADSGFRGHPWARLLLGCSLDDVSDPRGSAHTVAALRAFRRSGDSRGVAYACFVLGCRAVEHGDIGRNIHPVKHGGPADAVHPRQPTSPTPSILGAFARPDYLSISAG